MMKRILIGALSAAMAVTGLVTASSAAEITRKRGSFPISTSVHVPAGSDTWFFSGVLPAVADKDAPEDSPARYGNTETQSLSVFTKIKETLEANGLTLGDVVLMHVYLVGDPAKGGKMDFAGMMAAYTKFFGTPEQPNVPARSTVQIAGLAGPGFLVEIEVVAAKAK